MSDLQHYKALMPGSFDSYAELNNNCFTLKIRAELVKVEVDEKKIQKILLKEDLITGFWKEIKRVEGRRSGQSRDLTEEYNRLKYTTKIQEKFEKEMDSWAHTLRSQIVGGEITKRDGIDNCWLQGRYHHKLIMYITMSYYSTVYERKLVLQNEKKI